MRRALPAAPFLLMSCGAGELELVERADGRTVVKDCTVEDIKTPDDGIQLLHRLVGRTNPARSSRAHTIFSVVVTQSHKSGTEENKVGTFYCCRLGGCEKVSASSSSDQEQRQKEAPPPAPSCSFCFCRSHSVIVTRDAWRRTSLCSGRWSPWATS